MGAGISKSAAIFKMSVCHPKSRRALIHHLNKFVFCSCYVFCHGYGGVITWSDNNALDQGFHRLHFPFFQENLGTSHGLCVGAGHNLISQFDFTGIQRIKNKDQSHNFRYARRAPFFIRVLFINNLSGWRFHQNGAGRLQSRTALRIYPFRLFCLDNHVRGYCHIRLLPCCRKA